MSYNKYLLEDFIEDPIFRKWVLEPDPESNYFWEKWLLKNPEKKEIVEEARFILSSLRFKEEHPTKEQKTQLLKRIQHTNRKNNLSEKSEIIIRHLSGDQDKKTRRLGQIASYAAVIAGFIVVSTIVLLQNNNELDSQQDNVTSIVRENHKGQKRRLQLPDGSTVILNSSSKLTYPSGFVDNKREVFLSGEAFFYVTKDSLKPFLVRTNRVTARVLGTSFNVRAYPDSEEETIALVTGHVLVSGKKTTDDSMLLLPGESASVAKKTGAITKGTFDFEEEILWKDGILCFKEEPFKEVIFRLEQWYAVDISIENMPDKDLIVNGRFEDEYLDNVLKSMAFTAHFDFEIKGTNIQINFRN